MVVRDAYEVDPSAVRVTLFRGDALGGLKDAVCGWLIGPPLPGSSTASYLPSTPNVEAAEVLREAFSIGRAIGSRVYIIDPDYLYNETMGKVARETVASRKFGPGSAVTGSLCEPDRS